MITESNKSLFSDIFIKIARSEKKLEVIRQVLCEIEDFEPYTAFRRIDRSHKNYLTCKDIRNFLSENGIIYNEEIIINTFINHYDFDNDGNLCYSEFLRAILPGDHPILRTEVSQRPILNIKEDERLLDEIEYTLAKLIKEEIINYIDSEPDKSTLYYDLNKNYSLLFSLIDIKDNDFLDFNSLLNFFNQSGLYPYEEEIISVLRRLDKNDDGRINLEEFTHGLIPKINTNSNVNMNKNINFLHKNSSNKKTIQKKSPSKSPQKPYPFEAKRKSNSPNRESFKLKKQIDFDSPNNKRNKFKSFHKTDSKIDYKNLIKTSPFSKKLNQYDKLKKQIETELEISKKKTHINYNKNFKSEKKEATIFNYFEVLPNQSKFIEITHFLKKIIFLDREIERIKQDLALRPDFNLLDFFSIFDQNEKGYLNSHEMQNCIESFSIIISKDQYFLFISRFDKKNIGRFKFSDFVEIFTPIQEDYADLLNQRKPLNLDRKFESIQDVLSNETIKIIKNLLKSILDNEMEIEGLRRIMSKKLNIPELQEIFEFIDSNKNGFLTLKEIKLFLEKQEIYITDRDANCLFNRFDFNKKERISFAEFRKELEEKIKKY